jgi:hypothetical protein
VRRGQTERLPQILETIGERTRHLESFILGYARFAKLPTPRMEPVRLAGRSVDALASQVRSASGELPPEPACSTRADGTGAAQPAEERPRIGLAAGRRGAARAAVQDVCASRCWTAAAA